MKNGAALGRCLPRKIDIDYGISHVVCERWVWATAEPHPSTLTLSGSSRYAPNLNLKSLSRKLAPLKCHADSGARMTEVLSSDMCIIANSLAKHTILRGYSNGRMHTNADKQHSSPR